MFTFNDMKVCMYVILRKKIIIKYTIISFDFFILKVRLQKTLIYK